MRALSTVRARPNRAVMRTASRRLGDDAELVSVCRAHLDREEALLGMVHDSLDRVRSAILSESVQQLDQELASQEQLARQAVRVRMARDGLRDVVAPFLGVPPQMVTAGRIARALRAPDGARIEEARARLICLVRAIDTLERGNAALLGIGTPLLRPLLEGLLTPGTDTCPAHPFLAG